MKTKSAIWIACAICMCGLLFWYAKKESLENRKILTAEVLSQEEIDSLKEGKLSQAWLAGDWMSFGQNRVPYDGNIGVYYIPQSLENEEWQGELTAVTEDTAIYFYEDEYFGKKDQAIRENHQFRFLILGDGWYIDDEIAFSGLPAICIDGELEEDSPGTMGNVTVLNPSDADAGGIYTIKSAPCTYHVRGNTSREYEKKGFRLKLFDEKGENDSMSLLGLRSDNSWILNAMYADVSKIRDKLSYELWELVNQGYSGSRMEYAELFVNGFYRGLYALTEPTDRKQLDLQEGGILYKCDSWEIPSQADYAAAQGQLLCREIEIKYPKQWQEGLWTPVSWYTDFLTDGPEAERGRKMIDVENNVNFWLYIQLLAASDNNFKNTYLCVTGDRENPKLRKIPWDMNYSWGDHNTDNANKTAFGVYPVTRIYGMPDYEKLLASDYDTVMEMTKKRWRELRRKIYTEDNLCSMADQYMELLLASGAFDRDTFRWPNSGNSADLSQIKSFIGERIAWLDQVIEEESFYKQE